MKLILLVLLIAILVNTNGKAQFIPVSSNENAAVRLFPSANVVINRVFNNGSLDTFYRKLLNLKKTGAGTVTIVHIGDSHIQADFLSGLVRKDLQQFFGSAGRGLVFPYQLAISNAPSDIFSTSNAVWQFNRVAHPEIPINPGVSGYVVRTTTPGAKIDLSLRDDENGEQTFTRLKFFTDTSTSNSWLLQADNNGAPFLIKREEDDSSLYHEAVLEQPASSFSLSSLPSENLKEFYGVSLENSKPGVIYHTIGVNGARYDQYNIAPLFWKQLSALKADLYIVSLGTNEAQKTDFNAALFQAQVQLFISKLKLASPNAVILITTSADSYYQKRRPNAILREINLALASYCTQNDIPFWDLYRITNGYGSCSTWARRGLMNADRVHFTGDGYRVQGNLLFSALSKGFNNYASSY